MDVPGQHVLLILDIGIVRRPSGVVERRDGIAFLVTESVVSLACSMGAVYRHNRFMHFAVESPNPASEENARQWRPISMMPLEVKFGLDRTSAREQAGVDDRHADDNRILIGVGSLGSALADIWIREGWGNWTYVDPDHVQPHNLARHRAVHDDLGRHKAIVAKEHAEAVYSKECVTVTAITESATANIDLLTEKIRTARLTVDASTTLDVPRELSQRDGTSRMVSAFVTPSGKSSVLLLEDESRKITLDCIEAQYYRQILRAPWGLDHLVGHSGGVAVGAGCRDVSLVMSPEMIELHAAILARRIRVLSAREEPALIVWVTSEDGGVITHAAPVRHAGRYLAGRWHVVVDDEVVERMRELREQRLPKETGGIIVGYIDHASNTIYVVDVLAAPPDSIEGEGAFIRGSEGLPLEWKKVQDSTAHIVNYIGEWHSHPPRHGATPSFDDLRLVAVLGQVLARDGDPALMMIVASKEFRIFVCESDGASIGVFAESPAVVFGA